LRVLKNSFRYDLKPLRVGIAFFILHCHIKPLMYKIIRFSKLIAFLLGSPKELF
jgi:hypothetical protein